VPADPVQLALLEGARRSREACSVHDPAGPVVVIWRRHRWAIIGICLFLLMDVVLASGLVGTRGTHF
jgi:hypothetical protein